MHLYQEADIEQDGRLQTPIRLLGGQFWNTLEHILRIPAGPIISCDISRD